MKILQEELWNELGIGSRALRISNMVTFSEVKQWVQGTFSDTPLEIAQELLKERIKRGKIQ